MNVTQFVNMNTERVMDEMCKGIVSCQVTAEALRNTAKEYNKLRGNIENAQKILTAGVANGRLSDKMSDRVLELLKDAQPDIDSFPEVVIIDKRSNDGRD